MKTKNRALVGLLALLLAACSSAPERESSGNGAMTDEEIGAASAGLEAGNVATMKKAFARLPKSPSRWKEGDREVRDDLFAMELNRGRGCRPSVLDYLVSIGAITDWNALKQQEYRASSDAKYYEAAFCGKYLRGAYARQLDRQEVLDDNPGAWDALAQTMIAGTHKAFTDYTNWQLATAKDPNRDLDAYLELIRHSIVYGQQACLILKKSSQACPALSMYRRLGADMKRQDTEKATYAKKWAEIADALANLK